MTELAVSSDALTTSLPGHRQAVLSERDCDGRGALVCIAIGIVVLAGWAFSADVMRGASTPWSCRRTRRWRSSSPACRYGFNGSRPQARCCASSRSRSP
jgi:hypothetical protein